MFREQQRSMSRVTWVNKGLRRGLDIGHVIKLITIRIVADEKIGRRQQAQTTFRSHSIIDQLPLREAVTANLSIWKVKANPVESLPA